MYSPANTCEWWLKSYPRRYALRRNLDPFDHKMNRIERARQNAHRMGLELVVQAQAGDDSSYTLYTTSSPSYSKSVQLLDESGTEKAVIPRSSLHYNGDYLWLDQLSQGSAPVPDDMALFN